MTLAIFRAVVRRDEDVVQSRQWARTVAGGLGFSLQDQTRIATALSEIARNSLIYAKQGRIEFGIDEIGRRYALSIQVTDAGPGIDALEAVVTGRYRSKTGLGLGISGAKRLMDVFEIASDPSGTTVTMAKFLPDAASVTPQQLRDRADRAARLLERAQGGDAVAEVHQQNRELLASLQRLREREDELLDANAELREATEALSRSLREKEVLLREVHHRVKNNLQIITSFVALQSARSRSDEAKRELKALAGRVRALSLVHDKLYQGEDLARIDLRDYAGDLCAYLDTFLAEPSGNVTIACDFCRMDIPLDHAINIGLMLNEMVTNSYKHAFPDRRPGRITVCGRRRDHALELTVADDGIGMTGEPQRGRSLGRTLIESMAERLGGRVSVEIDGGTRTTITIPIPAEPPADTAERLHVAEA